jgi:hypothetical protein
LQKNNDQPEKDAVMLKEIDITSEPVHTFKAELVKD